MLVSPSTKHWSLIRQNQRELILKSLTTVGAVSLPILTHQGCLSLMSVARQLMYQAQPEQVGRGKRTVRQQIASCRVEQAPFQKLRQTLQSWLNEQLTQDEPYPFTSLVFNEMVLQKYQPGSLGITPHRDGKKYINLVCIVVLEGQGKFCICCDRAGNDPIAIDASPGRVILMRATGFRGVDLDRKERPFHFVSDIRSTRYTLGLRQNTKLGPA